MRGLRWRVDGSGDRGSDPARPVSPMPRVPSRPSIGSGMSRKWTSSQVCQFRSRYASVPCAVGSCSGSVESRAKEPPSEPAWRPYACSALKGLQIGAWRLQRICRQSERSWIVLSEQMYAFRKCFRSGMSARLTLANCAWKNVWRRRRRTCLTLHVFGIGIGASVAPAGISCVFTCESITLTEMNK
jgi:hypothetical protein